MTWGLFLLLEKEKQDELLAQAAEEVEKER